MWSKSAFYDFYVFFKDIKSQFSKANLGYLKKSIFALNNLKRKVTFKIFLIRVLIVKLGGGVVKLTPSGNPCLAKPLVMEGLK